LSAYVRVSISQCGHGSGDIGASSKQRFFKSPYGVVLITPESLEAMLCNRGTSVAGIFGALAFFVIDELHAFIGNERGKQLQSLMHRIEAVLGRSVPRIGLSATLGDMKAAARFLRPDGAAAIVDAPSSAGELRLIVKGFEEPIPAPEEQNPDRAAKEIAKHLFTNLRGSNNLIFPNSRREVERYTHLLNELCEQASVPRQFWPHHGNLSKELRYETEAALKQMSGPPLRFAPIPRAWNRYRRGEKHRTNRHPAFCCKPSSTYGSFWSAKR